MPWRLTLIAIGLGLANARSILVAPGTMVSCGVLLVFRLARCRFGRGLFRDYIGTRHLPRLFWP